MPADVQQSDRRFPERQLAGVQQQRGAVSFQIEFTSEIGLTD